MGYLVTVSKTKFNVHLKCYNLIFACTFFVKAPNGQFALSRSPKFLYYSRLSDTVIAAC